MIEKDDDQPFSSFNKMEDQNLNKSTKFENFKNFILKKKLYIISFFILFVIIIMMIVVISGEKSSQKTIDQNSSINEPYSKYCQDKTEKYINLINSLEEKNYIAYHYEFQKNSKGSFENKYQYLYENDTSLIPNNSEVGNYLFTEQSYLRNETDEINYYKNVLKKDPPKHFIYGPSYLKEDYNKGQKLYNPNIKINDTKDWEGITLSLNFKQYPFTGSSNGGKIFGWGNGDWAKPGFFISLTYGIVYYKQGLKNVRYDYEDSVKIGYNESIPETRHLTFRPFRDEKWHQITVSMRKVTKEDEKYLTELSLKEGNYKCELFMDGESRKNSTANPTDDYGEFSAFEFGNDEKMLHNNNFYMDNIIVLKKGIHLDEAKVLYDSIDQEAEKIIPDLPNVRCKIPGEHYGIKPDEVYPESKFPLKAETRFFQFTYKWSCLGFSYEEFLKQRLIEFCEEHLKTSDLHYLYNKLQFYQYANHYKYDILDVLNYYLPKINEKFKNLESFRNYVKISSTDENGNIQNHVISNFGYWISSEGLLQVEKMAEEVNGTMILPVANINYFAYFEIEGGFINNRIYTISVENSDDIKFLYNDKKI